MLRLAVIALLLANAGYYAYTQGWLRSAGLVTPEQAEPQRLQQQIRPETLKVLRAQGATNNPTPPPAPAAAPAADTAALASGHRPILIAYASQTGQAQQLAEQCAQPLHAAGWAVTVQALNHTTPAQLQAATHALFIVSTYGEGDAPDNAALFQRQCMAQALDLSGLQYSLLALGDRHYRQFCGFGRTLDAWLHAQQAQPLHERLEADQSGNAAATLAHWQNTLAAALHLDASAEPRPSSGFSASDHGATRHRIAAPVQTATV